MLVLLSGTQVFTRVNEGHVQIHKIFKRRSFVDITFSHETDPVHAEVIIPRSKPARASTRRAGMSTRQSLPCFRHLSCQRHLPVQATKITLQRKLRNRRT